MQTPFIGSFPAGTLEVRKAPSLPCIKCEKKDEDVEHVYVELPPYHSYMDSTSGQLEPASGARASIPEQEYWPEGTADRVRAARAPEPTGLSAGSPSYGKKPGSRRKKYKASVAAPESSEASIEFIDSEALESDEEMKEEPKDDSSDYVIYDIEPEEEETGYEKNYGGTGESQRMNNGPDGKGGSLMLKRTVAVPLFPMGLDKLDMLSSTLLCILM
ncbi:hypothetical protein OIU84_024706 [Salix udensis]|uniref:Uncharacterized protein n=1 Tax=Salix udensis TaxID=889485 RepID=A0AAD6KHU3_9ROSI|nr:hypothetical protein OIU84_024706 [Salix udensis]